MIYGKIKQNMEIQGFKRTAAVCLCAISNLKYSGLQKKYSYTTYTSAYVTNIFSSSVMVTAY